MIDILNKLNATLIRGLLIMIINYSEPFNYWIYATFFQKVFLSHCLRFNFCSAHVEYTFQSSESNEPPKDASLRKWR